MDPLGIVRKMVEQRSICRGGATTCLVSAFVVALTLPLVHDGTQPRLLSPPMGNCLNRPGFFGELRV